MLTAQDLGKTEHCYKKCKPTNKQYVAGFNINLNHATSPYTKKSRNLSANRIPTLN